MTSIPYIEPDCVSGALTVCAPLRRSEVEALREWWFCCGCGQNLARFVAHDCPADGKL
jgi:hypothetical protein